MSNIKLNITTLANIKSFTLINPVVIFTCEILLIATVLILLKLFLSKSKPIILLAYLYECHY